MEENGKQELHQAISKLVLDLISKKDFSSLLASLEVWPNERKKNVESTHRTHLGDGNVQKICLMPTFGLVSEIGSTTFGW